MMDTVSSKKKTKRVRLELEVGFLCLRPDVSPQRDGTSVGRL